SAKKKRKTTIAPKVVFECLICCMTFTENSRNKRVRCVHCQHETCNHCQKTYARANCMNCHVDFTKKELVTLLGKPFVQNDIIDNVIRELMLEEKRLIPMTNVLMTWLELQMKEKEMFLRHGQVPKQCLRKGDKPEVTLNVLFRASRAV